MEKTKLIKDTKFLRLISKTAWTFLAKNLNDRAYLKFKYFYLLRRKLDLDNPKLFSEKLQWLKLNDRKPVYHRMVDKAEVKNFIEENVGKEYNIPTLGIWDKFEDINFDDLPNEFIIKSTHDSGSYYVCRDKSKIDLAEIKQKLTINSENDYYIWSREWPYKGVKRRIIAEPLLHDQEQLHLIDYKFFTFNGVPKLLCIITNRGQVNGSCVDFFDVKGEHLDLGQLGYSNNINRPKLPLNLDKMIELSKILSKETYFLRVDFYEINGKLYVGEMTFYDDGGFCLFTPEKYNRIYGDYIKLPID